MTRRSTWAMLGLGAAWALTHLLRGRPVAHAGQAQPAQKGHDGSPASESESEAAPPSQATVGDPTRRTRPSQHVLQDMQRWMELAQQTGHVGFFEYRFETGQLQWTAGHAALFGLPAQPFESSLAEWIDCIEPDDQACVSAGLQTALAAQQAQCTFEYCVNRALHHGRWLSTRLTVQYDDGGQPEHMIGTTIDMSEQRRVEAEHDVLIERTRAARDEAEAANRAKDELLAMLGHELRNPLSAISAAVDVLDRVAPTAPVANNARAIVARQSRKLVLLLDDLLDIAQLLSGKVVLMRQRIDLALLVQRYVQSLQANGATDTHRLQLQLEDAWVDADPARVEQIVNSLLSNALQYTPPGTDIVLRVATDGDTAVLEVRDHGAGIAPELLPRVFDLFVQGERRLDRSAGGLGVGLPLVRRLVQLHQGTVDAHSSPAGSCFTVKLPAVPHPERVPPPSTLARAPVHQRRVVLVEDNADALDALRDQLELDGHTVWTAADGAAGLALLLQRLPDVAIVDIGLPELDGYEVARRSRAAGYAGRMLAISGYGQAHDVLRALKAGFDAHVVKPVDAERLAAELEHSTP